MLYRIHSYALTFYSSLISIRRGMQKETHPSQSGHVEQHYRVTYQDTEGYINNPVQLVRPNCSTFSVSLRIYQNTFLQFDRESVSIKRRHINNFSFNTPVLHFFTSSSSFDLLKHIPVAMMLVLPLTLKFLVFLSLASGISKSEQKVQCKPIKKEECVFVKKIKPYRPINPNPFSRLVSPCQTSFSAHHVDMEPYSGEMFRTILKETVEHCCWMRSIAPNMTFKRVSNLTSIIQDNLKQDTTQVFKRNTTQVFNRNTTQVFKRRIPRGSQWSLNKVDQSAHFIFPVLGLKKSTKVHGHFFIPLLNPPGAFYVTRKHGIDVMNLIQPVSYTHLTLPTKA